MCNCASCEYTDSFSQKGFDAWPKGHPKGPRKASAEYAAHVAFAKRGGAIPVIPESLRKFEPGFEPDPVAVARMVSLPIFTPPAPLPEKYRRILSTGYRITTSQTEGTS